MGIFKWRGRVSKAEYRSQFADYLRMEVPELNYTDSPDHELDLWVTRPGSGDKATSRCTEYTPMHALSSKHRTEQTKKKEGYLKAHDPKYATEGEVKPAEGVAGP